MNDLHKSRENLKTTGWSTRPRKALEPRIYTQGTSIVHLRRKLHEETWTSLETFSMKEKVIAPRMRNGYIEEILQKSIGSKVLSKNFV